MLPVLALRNPDDSYQAIGLPMIVADPQAEPKAEERRITELLVRHLERIIREHPDQWHVPHRIWADAP